MEEFSSQVGGGGARRYTSRKCKKRGGVKKFSNSRKLKIMVGVKVFAMKSRVTERILVGRTFDIWAILPLFTDFALFQGENAIFDHKIG